MSINIKYRSVKAFLLASHTGSFTQAADKMGLTQPSFTSLIQNLEQMLDIRLFERNTRKIELTSAGIEFLKRVEKPITDLEEAYISMKDLAIVRRGSIVLGSLPSTSLTLIPKTLQALRQSHPSLQIRIVEAHNDELIAMIRTNQIEFAIGAVTGSDMITDLQFHPLLTDWFSVIYPPQYAEKLPDPIYWRDLPDHDLILTSQGSTPRTQYELAIRNTKSSIASRYDVTHMTTAVQMIHQGLGITVLPQLALPALNLEGLLSRVLNDTTAKREIGLFHRKDRSLSPAANAFLQTIRTVIATNNNS